MLKQFLYTSKLFFPRQNSIIMIDSEVGAEAAQAPAPAAQEAREIMAYLGAICVPPGANAQLNVSAGE